MSGIPRCAEIEKAIRDLVQKTRQSQAALNRQAGMYVAKGRYEKADALVAKARALNDFQVKIKTLRDELRQLKRAGRGSGKRGKQTTPLWGYYQPILQTLLEMGGQARRPDLEAGFGQKHTSVLLTGDMEMMAGNTPRWQRMIRRARKHLIEQNFIENSGGKVWRITDEGRRAARSQKECTKDLN